MLIEQKEDHYLLYRNKMKMIECVKSNDCDFFKKCIQHEFPVNEMLIIETGDTLIHVLVKYNRIKMVKFVMTSNVGVNINKKNKSDLTALMLCCKNGNEAMARELIKNGANVNEKNILGDTALKLAQINKHDTLALMLLNNYKADIGLSKKY
jgi:ankyrin repeat protein